MQHKALAYLMLALPHPSQRSLNGFQFASLVLYSHCRTQTDRVNLRYNYPVLGSVAYKNFRGFVLQHFRKYCENIWSEYVWQNITNLYKAYHPSWAENLPVLLPRSTTTHQHTRATPPLPALDSEYHFSVQCPCLLQTGAAYSQGWHYLTQSLQHWP